MAGSVPTTRARSECENTPWLAGTRPAVTQ